MSKTKVDLDLKLDWETYRAPRGIVGVRGRHDTVLTIESEQTVSEDFVQAARNQSQIHLIRLGSSSDNEHMSITQDELVALINRLMQVAVFTDTFVNDEAGEPEWNL